MDPSCWTVDLLFGHPEIDRQHQEIIAIGKEIEAAFAGNGPEPKIIEQLTMYYNLLKRHFSDEEKIMLNISQDKYKSHIDAHRHLHESILNFVANAIKDIKSGLFIEIKNLFPYAFESLAYNVKFYDSELARIAHAENSGLA